MQTKNDTKSGYSKPRLSAFRTESTIPTKLNDKTMIIEKTRKILWVAIIFSLLLTISRMALAIVTIAMMADNSSPQEVASMFDKSYLMESITYPFILTLVAINVLLAQWAYKE
ncbi:hypothetical protein [Prosthecochloris sp.]|uniref:hypothetical protein n=1 Tax=Prosthecochloris sp. TaxID=290513 RepID=UPI0025CF42D5|nr:hypothetical protein [Prosthecochloris sp.]